jgi:hypothetical protein
VIDNDAAIWICTLPDKEKARIRSTSFMVNVTEEMHLIEIAL